MNRKSAVSAEVCPACGSLDVRAAEPRWFQVDLDRRDQLDDGWAEWIEFGCHECGIVWS
jgi:hypothetical protein